jgi:hypothetical protein
MVEQYWDFLHAPTQEEAGEDKNMGKYASAAARLAFSEEMLVDAEAPEHAFKIAANAALARRYPIQDAQDYLSAPQEQAQEELDAMMNGFKGTDRSSPDTEESAFMRDASNGLIAGTDLSPGSGQNDTCAGCSSPSIPDPALSLCGGFPG